MKGQGEIRRVQFFITKIGLWGHLVKRKKSSLCFNHRKLLFKKLLIYECNLWSKIASSNKIEMKRFRNLTNYRNLKFYCAFLKTSFEVLIVPSSVILSV